MKNTAVGIILTLTVSLVALLIHQARRMSQGPVPAAGSNFNEPPPAPVSEQPQEARSAVASEPSERFDARSPAITSQVAALTGDAGTGPQTKPAAPNPFTSVFKDPKTLEIIRRQEQLEFDRNFDRDNSRLLAAMHLTGDQPAGLKDLIWQKQTAGSDLKISLMSEPMEPAKRAELMRQVRTEKDAINEQIRQFLGPDNFAQYEAYESIRGERRTLGGFKKELADGSTPLKPDQEEQLLQMMVEERRNFQFTTDYSNESKLAGELAENFSEARLNQHFEEQAQLDERQMARAQGILAADQLEVFQQFLASQREMQKLIVHMGVKLLAPKQGSN